MAVDLSAIAKWPNVPACYDWLSLDRRGDWRLQGERVTHHGFIALLNRQYGVDDRGCWFVQNGPQRVFVALAYTPWIFRREGESLVSHTGEPAGDIKAVYLDEEGSILLETTLGIGLLDDRDLPAFLDQCRQSGNATVNEENWLKTMSGEAVANIEWGRFPLQTICQNEVAPRFNFQPNPKP
ncbi:MAG: DUF2946 family protein [Dechloromonas sp.]|nr:DUF2946 family protein [Dechloromonas sp.]